MAIAEPDPDFKYIAKVKVKGGKYRYFYDEETYKNFLNKGKEVVDKIKGLGTLVQTIPGNVAKEAGKVAKAAEKAVTDFLPPKSIAALPLIKGKHSEDEDMSAINEKYKSGAYQYMLNCMFATTAYELRRRGYDVEADAIRRQEVNTYSVSDMSSWFENPKPQIIHTVSTNNEVVVKQILKTSPPGSRGNMCVFWKGGGGHSMAYEVNSSGKVVIRDCQVNKVVKLSSLLEEIKPEFVITRTDNLKLKEGVLDVIARN